MHSSVSYGESVEALTVLETVDGLQREALRKAVHEAGAAQQQARTAVAAQQRMYDRASREADEAERLLSELRVALGLASPAVTPRAGGTSLPLAAIRGSISEVARWAADAKPVVDSLLRTSARFAQTASAQAPVSPTSAKRSAAWLFAVVATLVLIVAVVTVILIAQ